MLCLCNFDRGEVTTSDRSRCQSEWFKTPEQQSHWWDLYSLELFNQSDSYLDILNLEFL